MSDFILFRLKSVGGGGEAEEFHVYMLSCVTKKIGMAAHNFPIWEDMLLMPKEVYISHLWNIYHTFIYN